jgi:hypothetical protein
MWSESVSADRITDAQLCALAASVSTTHISPSYYILKFEGVRKSLHLILSDLARATVANTEYARRKTMLAQDVLETLVAPKPGWQSASMFVHPRIAFPGIALGNLVHSDHCISCSLHPYIFVG